MVQLIKPLLLLTVLVLSLGAVTAAENMGNKYLVSEFEITGTEANTYFTANITNQNGGAVGTIFYEISTSPAANHENVLQSGTFEGTTDSIIIGDFISFPYDQNTQYYILVYVNDAEHDNRVFKDTSVYVTPDNPPSV
jgi:hypothetical protein